MAYGMASESCETPGEFMHVAVRRPTLSGHLAR